MANDTILTDDYVAGLLAKEASDASIKYSSAGLEAFRSTKPANKAKPNTQFLGRIIKETTSHNAALLAREAAEAQARLNDLTQAEEKRRLKLNPSVGDIRRRQLGDISSILSGRKRKRADEKVALSKSKGASSADDKEQDLGDKVGRERKESHHAANKDVEMGGDERHRDRHSDRYSKDVGRRRRDRSRSPDSRSRKHRERYRSPLSGSEEDGDASRREPHRRRSGKNRELSGGDLIAKEISKRQRHGRLARGDDLAAGVVDRQDKISSRAGGNRLSKEDRSDPLKDLIGPAPPSQPSVRPRGRGAARGSAVMDSRFSDAYDPQSDVQLELEHPDEWDDAVETYRDRQKWKQQGADRLRAAGFTDEQIKTWEKGGEKDISDVQWTKAGEGREWDRGKDTQS